MSQIIIIYGPPGVGKLTVAKILEKQLGNFKLFHNHHAVDYAESLFGKSDQTGLFVKRLRLMTLREALHRSLNLIMTIAYNGTENHNERIRGWIKMIRSQKEPSTIHFVRLTASKEVLYARVKHPDRLNYGKITTIKKLKHVMKTEGTYDIPIPFVKSTVVDTTNNSAADTVKQILAEIPEIRAYQK